MLTDYARYIENIRNGLIQCGVVFPQIDDIAKSDYGVLFHIGEKLTDVMYFYKIMVCSGNIEGMFLPMDKSYRGAVRMQAFLEFEEDILPSLKEQFGDEDDNSFSLESVCDVEGAIDDADEEPEVWVNDDVSAEDTLIEASDLFDDEDDEVVSMDLQFAASGASLWSASSTEWVSQGTSLFSKKVEDPKEYVPQGVELFSVSTKTAIDSVQYVPNGVELFSIAVNSTPIGDADPEEGIVDWVDDTEDDSEVLDEDSQDVWVEDSEDSEDDQDVWVSDEDDQDVWVDEVEDDQDSWVADEDDQDTWVGDPEDTGEVWEDASEDDQDSWTGDEDDIGEDESGAVEWEGDGPPTEIAPLPKPVVKQTPKPQPVKDPNYEPDIVDVVQEAASAALTSAKQFLANLTNPKK